MRLPGAALAEAGWRERRGAQEAVMLGLPDGDQVREGDLDRDPEQGAGHEGERDGVRARPVGAEHVIDLMDRERCREGGAEEREGAASAIEEGDAARELLDTASRGAHRVRVASLVLVLDAFELRLRARLRGAAGRGI